MLKNVFYSVSWSFGGICFQAAIFSILLVFLLASSMVNVAFAISPEVTYEPLDKTFVDPYKTVGSSTIRLTFSEAMDTASVEDSFFIRHQYHEGIPVSEIDASLTTYLWWFGPGGVVDSGKFAINWTNDTILDILFDADIPSPTTGSLLEIGGKYLLMIAEPVTAEDKEGEILTLPDGRTDYTFYVPDYGNVDLSDQEVERYVNSADAEFIIRHLLGIYNIYTYFASFNLSQTLADKVGNVDGVFGINSADAEYIIRHLLGVPGYEEFPAAVQPAPSLQQPAAGDIFVSIGELKDPQDCSVELIVIHISQGETSKEVPINICGLESASKEIDTAEIFIQYDPNVVSVDHSQTRLNSPEVVPDGWDLDANLISGTPEEYRIIINAAGHDPITTDGAILYVTFVAKSDIPSDKTNVTFSRADFYDVTGGPAELLPVTPVEPPNEIALPVTLSALGAMWHPDGGIRIFWEAESQHENLGWNVYRSETKDGKFVKINGDLIEGTGTTATSMKYHFVDKDIISGKSYFYYLENISFGGEKDRSHIIEATIVNQLTSWGAIKNSSLRQIPLAVPRSREPIVFVKVYDAKGNLVRNKK